VSCGCFGSKAIATERIGIEGMRTKSFHAFNTNLPPQTSPDGRGRRSR
jgi:hypothetical protein